MKFDDIINAYMNTSFFVESPMYYDGVFNEEMQDIQHNKKITHDIITKHKPFDHFKSWQVYRVQDGFFEDKYTFCLIKDKLVDAFVDIASYKANNYINGVWQRKTDVKGLIRDFIVNFLPKCYTSLISDKTANKLGIAFYKKLLDELIQKGCRITVLNGSHKNEEQYNPAQFNDYWHNVNRDVPTHPTFITSKDVLFKIYFK